MSSFGMQEDLILHFEGSKKSTKILFSKSIYDKNIAAIHIFVAA